METETEKKKDWIKKLAALRNFKPSPLLKQYMRGPIYVNAPRVNIPMSR